MDTLLTQQIVRDMDTYAFRLTPDAEVGRMLDFAAGRNATLHVFADKTVPEDLHEAARDVRLEAAAIPAFAESIDTEEFALASMMMAYAIRRTIQ